MGINTKDLTLVAIFASLYAALVVAFAPISFYAIQFRIAGIIRPAIAKKPSLVIGYVLGVVVANLFSPFGGFHELVFMPFMSFMAGILGYYAARVCNRNYFVAGAIIASIIAISVSWMLNNLFGLPVIATLPGIFVSEQIVNILGSVILVAVDKRYRWYE